MAKEISRETIQEAQRLIGSGLTGEEVAKKLKISRSQMFARLKKERERGQWSSSSARAPSASPRGVTRPAPVVARPAPRVVPEPGPEEDGEELGDGPEPFDVASLDPSEEMAVLGFISTLNDPAALANAVVDVSAVTEGPPASVHGQAVWILEKAIVEVKRMAARREPEWAFNFAQNFDLSAKEQAAYEAEIARLAAEAPSP